MKTPSIALLAFVSGGIALAQGPLTPPLAYDPNIGPANALNGGGQPQATMKTLHQVEARTPLAAGQPGVTQNPNGGFTITAPGSYYLTASFGVSTGSGIRVEADYVTLDLNGMNINSNASPASGAGVEVPFFQKGLTVRNGFILGLTQTSGAVPPHTYTAGGFTAGILSNVTGPAGSAYAATIENIDVRACAGHGMYVLGGKYRGCVVDGCSGTGIEGTTAVDCNVSRCGSHGISVDVASGCESFANGGKGFWCITVDQCVATENSGYGIQASVVTMSHAEGNDDAGFVAKTVSDCTSTNNWTYGIAAEIVTNSSAEGNSTGIGASNGSVTNCRARNNITIGIHAWRGNVINSLAQGNEIGISASYGSVSNSSANGNDAGIDAPNGSVTNCSAWDNFFTGISAYEGTVSNCVATANGVGINANFGVVTGCTATSNFGIGIEAFAGSVSASAAHLNAQHGIYATNGTISNCAASGNNTSATVPFTDIFPASPLATRTGNFPTP